ncbi:MAG TPA: phosphoserine phosphatase SerB [Alphaproteobacteria bacterium]|nr:phosphoserine phosphatase SerB [Alphaproteobacteria bacterium]
MTHVLVLIANPARAGLHDSIAEQTRAALAEAGAAPGPVDWLAPGIAAEIPFAGDPAVARGAALVTLAQHPIDGAVLPAAGRRKGLLIADMESTLIENEFLDDIAARAGIGPKIADITRRAMAGELDFAGALRERVSMLRGLNADLLDDVYGRLRFMPGARTLIATMRRHGKVTAIVSGGFRFFAERVRATLGAELAEANELEVVSGRLTGKVREPIFDRQSKRATLERLAAARGLSPTDTIAVGDGANDIEMVRAAGLGVAFRAKPILAEAAAVAIRHGDLTALLYLQGYRQSEFDG